MDRNIPSSATRFSPRGQTTSIYHRAAKERIQIMTRCPSTSADVKISSDKLNCTPSLVYHCLRDQAGRLTEKCIKPSWIQKGHCAEYNTVAQRLDAKACTATLGLCPQKPYLSNDVISYSGCVPTERESVTITTATSPDKQTESSGINVPVVVIPIMVLIVLVCIGVAAVFIYHRRRQRALGNNGNDEESEELLTKGRGNESKENPKEVYLKKAEESLKFFIYKGRCRKNMLEKTRNGLLNNKNVVIVGKPGSGKTTLAWTVCKQMHGVLKEGKRWHMTVSTDTEDIPDDNEMVLLLLDGSFENNGSSEGTVGKIMEKVDKFSRKLPGKKIVIIVTISQHIFGRIEKFNCFRRLTWEIIDLDNKANALTSLEMSKVFETYDISIQNVTEESGDKVLSQEQLQSVNDHFQHHNTFTKFRKRIFTTPKLGFPLIASLMAANTAFLGNVDFVKEPIGHILRSTNGLKESEKHEEKNMYCTLVYAAFNGGYVDMNNLDRDMLQKIGTQHDNENADINTEFYLLRERRHGVYEFVHESIMQAFLAAYGKQYLGFVIKHCPLDVLLEYSVSARWNIQEKEKTFYLLIGGAVFEKNLETRIMSEKFDVRHYWLWELKDLKNNLKEMYAKPDTLKESVVTTDDRQ